MYEKSAKKYTHDLQPGDVVAAFVTVYMEEKDKEVDGWFTGRVQELEGRNHVKVWIYTDEYSQVVHIEDAIAIDAKDLLKRHRIYYNKYSQPLPDRILDDVEYEMLPSVKSVSEQEIEKQLDFWVKEMSRDFSRIKPNAMSQYVYEYVDEEDSNFGNNLFGWMTRIYNPETKSHMFGWLASISKYKGYICLWIMVDIKDTVQASRQPEKAILRRKIPTPIPVPKRLHDPDKLERHLLKYMAESYDESAQVHYRDWLKARVQIKNLPKPRR